MQLINFEASRYFVSITVKLINIYSQIDANFTAVFSKYTHIYRVYLK